MGLFVQPGSRPHRVALRDRTSELNTQSRAPTSANSSCLSKRALRPLNPSTKNPNSKKESKTKAQGVASTNNKEDLPQNTSLSLRFHPDAEKPRKTGLSRRDRYSLDTPNRPRETSGAQRRCHTARKSKDCLIPGCAKGARSKGLCKRHGGGKRCTHSSCTRSDQGGGFCIAHGGGVVDESFVLRVATDKVLTALNRR